MTPGELWNACVSEAGHPEMAYGFTNLASVPASCWFLHVEPTDERCATATRAFVLARQAFGVPEDTVPGDDATIRQAWKRAWANGRRHPDGRRCGRDEFGGVLER